MMDDDAPLPGRSVDIELGGQEVITIDLDNLDENPDDVLELLKDGQCKVYVWTKLAGEYWRRGYLDAAERIATSAVESFKASGLASNLPPIYALLANLQIAHARRAPKLILNDAKQDVMKSEKSKDAYYKEAALYINTGERLGADATERIGETLAFLTRGELTRLTHHMVTYLSPRLGVHQLATRSMDDALRSFDGVLAAKPTNVVALLGKARILYLKRNYKEALKLFQDVLRYNPNCNPDPRIGIGLCLWAMDHKAKAKAAWQRSLDLHPDDWSVRLLLGLEAINSSRTENLSEIEKAKTFLVGTKLVETAFKTNNRNASAANALCEIFLKKGNVKSAMKLAERTVQCADTLSMLTEGYLRCARVSHASGALQQAGKFYAAAIDHQSKNVVAAIGRAQIHLHNDEMAAAIHTLDTLLQPPAPQRSLEASVMLASLRAFPRPGISSADMAQDRTRARDLFDRVMKDLELQNTRNEGTRSSLIVAEDVEMHVEIARLWQVDNLDRMGKALKEALRISEAANDTDPRLINNVGVLQHLESNFEGARVSYETALTKATTLNPETAEGLSTTVLYNLARVYEDGGDQALADDAYAKLLARHPEYIDAKVRQARVLAELGRVNEAHDILKQCLASQMNNLNLRAVYTHFLIQTNLPKVAKEFVYGTLKEDKHDIYSLCAAGWIMYQQSRDSKETGSKALEDRRKGFQRAAEFYDKALQLDSSCAFAAQGLAIVIAEDALGTLGGAMPRGGPPVDEGQKRWQNAREALDIFGKVRESFHDGSVYFNMGHCYYVRDEFDRAIESYETASTRFYHGQNFSVLLCLCRSWYAKAIKDQNYSSMKTALKYAQQALHLHPHDKAVLYNIAMIEQKSAELLFSVHVSKRTLKDLEKVIAQATHAQKLFDSLAKDKGAVPYDPDIADNRRKYGDTMLRKAQDHLKNQHQYEADNQARLDAARRRRQEEKERQEALEAKKREQERLEAERLAEERRIAIEQAKEWAKDTFVDSEEEKERKPKRQKKPRSEAPSGDEAEPKKKRRGKLKKASSDHGEEDLPMASDDEEIAKPAKKPRPTKKRVVRDDDEEDTAGPRKKQYKSKEVLSDTDEEMS